MEQQIDSAPDSANSAKTDAAPLEFLTFRLGNEEYGIDIQQVHELRGYDKVTRIANAPESVKGVIYLRGAIVQIIDMRIRLSLGVPVYNEFTVVIILNVSGRTVGIVVDSVSDVIKLTPDQIQPPPVFDASSDTEFVTGLGTLDERMLILLDLGKLISGAELEADEVIGLQ